MIALGVDPSSRCIGLALVRGGDEPEAVLTAWRIAAPSRLAGAAAHAHRRLRVLTEELHRALEEGRLAHETRRPGDRPPDAVVIETPGKSGSHRASGSRTHSLPVYARGVGAAEAVIAQRLPETPVVCLTSGQWTLGEHKGSRAAWLAQCFPVYRPEDDPGQDVADAIGVALFALRRGLVAQAVDEARKEREKQEKKAKPRRRSA